VLWFGLLVFFMVWLDCVASLFMLVGFGCLLGIVSVFFCSFWYLVVRQ